VTSSLTAKERNRALELHNQLRARVANGRESNQPAAANMGELTWDDELAAIAQRWADQCAFGHDQNRDVSRFKVGQNVFIEGESGRGKSNLKSLEKGIMLWYDEVAEFDPNIVGKYR